MQWTFKVLVTIIRACMTWAIQHG